jgi:Kef-type K+ transport system membrane component KefB
LGLGESNSIYEYLDRQADRHVEDLIKPISDFLVPLFFVSTGMVVQLDVFTDTKTVALALGITVAAILTKLAAGAVAGRVNRLVVGVGMIPRGEVGLIFAATGKALGVVTPQMYAIIVIVVVFTTLLPPPVLAVLLRRMNDGEQ